MSVVMNVEICRNATCNNEVSEMIPANAEERRKLNYPGRENWILLCPSCYDMCIEILGYDPAYRNEPDGLPVI